MSGGKKATSHVAYCVFVCVFYRKKHSEVQGAKFIFAVVLKSYIVDLLGVMCMMLTCFIKHELHFKDFPPFCFLTYLFLK